MDWKDVIEGHYNEFLGKNSELAKSRLEICHKCPIYSPKLGGICNRDLWLNPKTNDVSTKAKKGYIQGCGCRVEAKATLPYAECIASKW